jgi:hypothetical protein
VANGEALDEFVAVSRYQLAPTEAVRNLLLAISLATIDRLLSDVRLVAQGIRRRRAVPVRTFGDWNARRRGSSRRTSSRMPALRWPAASCRRWR